MDIKRQVAKLLAVVMFFSTLQNVSPFSLKAADTLYGFEVLQKILVEGNPGLEESNRVTGEDETALAKWEMSATGNYVLNYYIQDGNDTKKVEMLFKYMGDTIDLKGRVGNEKITITEREFKTDKWINKTTSSALTFEKQFNIGTSARENKDYSIVINNITINQKNLTLRVKVDMTKDVPQIQVYTTGIEKGYINEFTLQKIKYDNEIDEEKDNNRKVEDAVTKQFFNGPKNFTITPVHLTDDTLKSTDLIDDINSITPGSKPGIKIALDNLKYLNGDKFEEMTETTPTTKLKKVSIRLAPQYSNSNDYVAGDGSVSLRFVPIENKDIEVYIDGEEQTGKKVKKSEDGKQINVYLTKEEISSEHVVTWETLTPSMVVIGTFSLENDANQYTPENKGHTYLKYTISKANSNQVKFIIEPYNINSKATYIISSSEWSAGSEFKEKVIYEYDPSKTNNKEITAIVENSSVNYYKIEVKIDNQIYVSQVIKYDPKGFVIQPSVSSIKTIENIYAVPNYKTESNANYPLAIGFDLKWSAPDNLESLLTHGDLYYELLLRENKNDKDPITTPNLAGTEGYAAYSKIFKVSKDNSDEDKVIVEVARAGENGPLLGTAGQLDEEDETEAKYNRYNMAKGEFSMENISLMNLSPSWNKWEQITFPDNYNYATSGNYLEGFSVGDTLSAKPIPGVYYLSLRTVYVPKDSDKSFTYSSESNLESISLDLVNEIVPVPVGITSQDVTVNNSAITEKIEFDYVSIESYVKKMLQPAGLKLSNDKDEKYSGEYILYLYQKDEALTESNVEDITPIDVKLGEEFNITSAMAERLRAGEVIAVKVKISELKGEGRGNIKFKGLDSNQVYYLQARTKLLPKDSEGKEDPRYSLLSKIFTFTTAADLVPPRPEDKKPTAPRDLTIVEDSLTKNSVKLQWKVADFEKDSDVQKTYYEVIRADKNLSDSQKGLTIEELIAANNKWVGFSSFDPNSSNYNSTDYMMVYTSETNAWKALEPAQIANNSDDLDTTLTLFDDSLKPNQIYYYYVRTVAIINGVKVNSGWIMVPVTTAPVGKPENLKVELKDYDYDAKRETVISFDAPIPDGAKVPDEFEFEIAVLGTKDADYRLDYPTKLITSTKDHAGTPAGYTHFVYKITGLNPNTRYDIKVRIKDKTQDISDGSSYPTSSYCDPVATRTEYDEDYEEEQKKYEEFLKKFDQEVEKLGNREYWVVEEDTTYKYRNDYMNAKAAMNNEYNLVVEDDSEATYYIPAEAFMTATENNTTLNITIGDYSASIRPYTLTESTEEIEEVLDQIANNKIEDYYIQISFSLNSISGTVGGQNVLSPKMIIDMEVVYSKEEEDHIEYEIEEALTDLAANSRKDVIKQLKKKVDNGKIDEDVLSDIVSDEMEELESDLAKKVKKILNNKTKKKVSINKIEKAILLIAKIDAYAADGYYYSGNWMSVDVYSALGGFSIEANQLGAYVITGQASLLDTVPSLAPYQSFISKYHLTDIFTLDGYMIKTAVRKDQLYGAVARVLGAPRNTDNVTYLKSKNIQGLSTLRIGENVRQDETVYIVMQAYEKLYNRPVSTIAIKNRQSVQNIGAFQPVYRNYVYAAVELKIVEPTDNKVMPSKQMTVEEVIKLLYKVQSF